jgi:hypothetical protein
VPNIVGPSLDVFAYRAPGEPSGTISMPVRDHVNAATAISIATSALAPTWFEHGTVVDFNICQGNVLTMQRNDLVQRMRGDWLMFIDDDMVWNPGQLVQLIKTRDEFDLDMVGAVCFRRTAPFQPTMYVRTSPTSGPFNYLEDWPADQAVEVDATGMAFVIIHKRVFERVVAYYENQPGWTMPPFEERINQSPPNFFRWNGGYGEDLQFCIDAKLSGSRIFVDTGIEVRHVAEVQIGREQFLAEIAKRSPELEAERQTLNDGMGLPTLTRAQARERLGW